MAGYIPACVEKQDKIRLHGRMKDEGSLISVKQSDNL